MPGTSGNIAIGTIIAAAVLAARLVTDVAQPAASLAAAPVAPASAEAAHPEAVVPTDTAATRVTMARFLTSEGLSSLMREPQSAPMAAPARLVTAETAERDEAAVRGVERATATLGAQGLAGRE